MQSTMIGPLDQDQQLRPPSSSHMRTNNVLMGHNNINGGIN